MQIYVTTLGTSILTNALATDTPVDIVGLQTGSAIISGDSEATLVALTGVVGEDYATTTPEISYTIQNSNIIVFKIILDTTVGNFNIGNYGLFDSNGNLILIVALDTVLPKYNTTSVSGANYIELYPTLSFTNATTAVNLSIYITNTAALPTVANPAALPPAGTTEYNAYIVLSDTNTNNQTDLYLSNGTAFVGMTANSWLSSAVGFAVSSTLTPTAMRNVVYNTSTSAVTYTIANGKVQGQQFIIYGSPSQSTTIKVNTNYFVFANTNTTAASFVLAIGYGVNAKLVWDGTVWRVERSDAAIYTNTALGGSLVGFLPNPTLNATGVTAGAYTLLNATILSDGRISAAASATSISVPGAISAGTTLYAASLNTTPTGYLNAGSGASGIGGSLSVGGNTTIGGTATVNTLNVYGSGGWGVGTAHEWSTDATGFLNIGIGNSNIQGPLVLSNNLLMQNNTYTAYWGASNQTTVNYGGFATTGSVVATEGTIGVVTMVGGNLTANSGTISAINLETTAAGSANVGTGGLGVTGIISCNGNITSNNGSMIVGASGTVKIGSSTWEQQVPSGGTSEALESNVGIVGGATAMTVSGGWTYGGGGPGASSTGSFNITAGLISGYSATANGFFSASDIRLKNERRIITNEEGLAYLNAVDPMWWIWNNKAEKGRIGTGYIAQQQIAVGYEHLVFPMPHKVDVMNKETHIINGKEFVSPADIRYGTKYDDTLAYLHAALRGAWAQNIAHEARIAALEANLR